MSFQGPSKQILSSSASEERDEGKARIASHKLVDIMRRIRWATDVHFKDTYLAWAMYKSASNNVKVNVNTFVDAYDSF